MWNSTNTQYQAVVPANCYYGILQNVASGSYFGSYEEDDVSDFFTQMNNMGNGVYVGDIWIQGDHMDPQVYTKFFE